MGINLKCPQNQHLNFLHFLKYRLLESKDIVLGAAVRIYQDTTLLMETSTGNIGSFEVTLPIGSYRIEIESLGYLPFTDYVTIEQNGFEYLLASLTAIYGTVTGTVSDAINGSVLEGVKIEARAIDISDEGDIVGTVYTNSSGSYSITIQYGEYTLPELKTIKTQNYRQGDKLI